MSGQRTYNTIYNSLVRDENDIAGIIAYSVYKRQKIEYINNFQKDKHQLPNDEDLKAFTDMSVAPSQLEFYQNEAAFLTEEFLTNVLAEDIKEREALFTTKVHAELSNIKPNHLLDIIKGATGSLVFVLLTGVLYFAVWSFSASPTALLEEIFDVEIISINPKGAKGHLGAETIEEAAPIKSG